MAREYYRNLETNRTALTYFCLCLCGERTVKDLLHYKNIHDSAFRRVIDSMVKEGWVNKRKKGKMLLIEPDFETFEARVLFRQEHFGLFPYLLPDLYNSPLLKAKEKELQNQGRNGFRRNPEKASQTLNEYKQVLLERVNEVENSTEWLDKLKNSTPKEVRELIRAYFDFFSNEKAAKLKQVFVELPPPSYLEIVDGFFAYLGGLEPTRNAPPRFKEYLSKFNEEGRKALACWKYLEEASKNDKCLQRITAPLLEEMA